MLICFDVVLSNPVGYYLGLSESVATVWEFLATITDPFLHILALLLWWSDIGHLNESGSDVYTCMCYRLQPILTHRSYHLYHLHPLTNHDFQ